MEAGHFKSKQWCGNFTAASPGGEVVVEACGTLALIHARNVDTLGWCCADAGEQLALIEIWEISDTRCQHRRWLRVQFNSNPNDHANNGSFTE